LPSILPAPLLSLPIFFTSDTLKSIFPNQFISSSIVSISTNQDQLAPNQLTPALAGGR